MWHCRKLAAYREAAIHTRTISWIESGLLVWLLGVPGPTKAAELKPEAVQGFDRYVQLTEQRMQTELRPGGAFLWVDGMPAAHRDDAYTRLRRGEVVTGRLETRDSSGHLRVPGALIHHWVGTVFIPGASLEQVGDDFKVYFRLTRKKIVTVVLDTEYEVHYERVDATRVVSRSYSTRIA